MPREGSRRSLGTDTDRDGVQLHDLLLLQVKGEGTNLRAELVMWDKEREREREREMREAERERRKRERERKTVIYLL